TFVDLVLAGQQDRHQETCEDCAGDERVAFHEQLFPSFWFGYSVIFRRRDSRMRQRTRPSSARATGRPKAFPNLAELRVSSLSSGLSVAICSPRVRIASSAG